MSKIIGVGSLSLTDLNDAWSGTSPPTNPSNGSVWIDLSVSPAMVKRYNGVTWVDIGELDPDLSETITNIHNTLGNMANDNKVDFNERQIIKDKVSEIIGFIIGNTSSLPTVATLDNDKRGSFYSVRQSALNAGLTTSTTEYVEVATRYNNLRTYLNGLTPIKPWDTNNSNKDRVIDVVKDTFRDRWLQYFVAVEKLATRTAEKLKQNVDDIDIGIRNLIQSDLIESVGTINKTQYVKKGILNISVSGSTDGARWTIPSVKPNTEYTLSYTYKKISGTLVSFGGHTDSTYSNNTVYVDGVERSESYSNKNSVFVGNDTNPHKVVVKFKTPSTVNANHYVYIQPNRSESVSATVEISDLVMVQGNRAVDWIPSLEDSDKKIDDLEGRIVDVEFAIDDESIVMKVRGSEKYLQDRNQDKKESKDYADDKAVETRQYVDSKTGNLIENPSLTGEVGKWTVSSGYSISVENQDFFGESIPVLRNTNNHESSGAQVYSNWFDVDPTKMYEVSFWVKSSVPSNNAGSTYLGLNVRNKSSSTIGVERITVENGNITNSNDTNFYFWSTTDTESLGDWTKVVGFILPAGFDLDNSVNISETAISSARVKSATRSARIRWLNYYNYGVTRTVWVANPKVIEMSSEIATSTQRQLLISRVNNVEQEITPEGISTVIEESTFYEEYLQNLAKKADLEEIGDLVTKDELEGLSDEVRNRIADAMGEIDLEPYATRAELEEKSTHIASKFSATGGMNLIKNSIGFGGFSHWSPVYTNSFSDITTISNYELDALGFGSGFSFNNVGRNKGIYQDVPVIAGVPIVFSWYMNKSSSGSGSDHRMYFQIQEGGATRYSHPDNSTRVTNGFEHEYAIYTPESNTIRIRLIGYKMVEATITGLMMNIGDIPLKWSLSTGESYNTNVRMDVEGIRVSQIEDGREVGYTHMSTDEFAGYYDADGSGNYEKIFYLNKDETVTKKVRAKEEMNMGSIKMINVDSGDYKGWAFVPISD